MTKLSQDQKELIEEIVGTPTWDAMLTLCKMAVERQERNVLNTRVDTGSRDAVINLSKLQGAKDVSQMFWNIKEQLRSK